MSLMGSSSYSLVSIIVVFCLVLNAAVQCYGGITSTYRRSDNFSADMPVDSPTFYVPPGRNTPQQVHITQGDYVGTAVIVSWITPIAPGSRKVQYWSENDNRVKSAEGIIERYTYYNYTFGYIHHANISNLEIVQYQVLLSTWGRRIYSDILDLTPSPPGPDVPYTFGLIGDLGQTFYSNNTLTHYQNDPLKGQTLLYLGDLSYANDYPFHDNTRWDTWGRFIERSAAYQPWIWAVGNHETDWAPQLGEPIPFVPYSHRFHTPYQAAGSTEPFWYSIKRGPAHNIVMATYSAFGFDTPQYRWFNEEIQKVNRSETPWLIITMHPPMYNSYHSHYMEGETMRVIHEKTFVQYKVDTIFAGHVHAYER